MELISKKEKIKDGETFVDKGTWAYYAYVLKSGKAKVFKTVSDKRVLIGTLNKGSIFGEVAFLGLHQIQERPAFVFEAGVPFGV